MVYTQDFPELDINEVRWIGDHKVQLASDVQGQMHVQVDDAVLPLDAVISLIGPQRMVERFHARSDQYANQSFDFDPESISKFIDHYSDQSVNEQDLADLFNLRRSLVGEEAKELKDALNALEEVMINYRDGRNYTSAETVQTTLAWVLKEISDVVVVSVGTAARLGAQADLSFLEVAKSNLTKVSPPEFRDDGKIQKGPNYKAPSQEGLLQDRF